MIAAAINQHALERNGPYVLDVRPMVRSRKLPNDYFRVVAHANGFVTRGVAFRFFGLQGCGALPDIVGWNAGAWLTEYGEIADNLVFVAEDAFGDQYGYSYREAVPRLVKFWCEGGDIAPLPYESLEDWLRDAVLTTGPSAFDRALYVEAQRRELRPGPSEHLSFALPLVTGGEYSVENLEVLDSQFHLHLLGQMSRRNRTLPEGTRIRRFWSES
jgi:hypothetical protein